MGMTLASFNLEGWHPVWSERFINFEIGEAISSFINYKISSGMLPGLHAFPILNFEMILMTSSVSLDKMLEYLDYVQANNI